MSVPLLGYVDKESDSRLLIVLTAMVQFFPADGLLCWMWHYFENTEK
jgi:hypothetical protein